MTDQPERAADEPGEQQRDHRVDGRCPTCGSRRVHYHVSRTGAWGHPAPERSLVWECRDCRTRWTERLVAVFGDDSTPETSSRRRPRGSDTPPRIPKDPI